MKCYVKDPGCAPVWREIDNNLKTLQTIVGGHIEVIRIATDLVLICNEEGKLLGMEPNLRTVGDVIAGPVIVCGTDGDLFCDIPSEFRSPVFNLLDRMAVGVGV